MLLVAFERPKTVCSSCLVNYSRWRLCNYLLSIILIPTITILFTRLRERERGELVGIIESMSLRCEEGAGKQLLSERKTEKETLKQKQ